MKTYKILLVDDDAAVLRLISRALERLGYRVETTGSGSDAVDILAKTRFDLVLTDLIMEPVDGLKVLEASKQANPDTPVIMLTGHNDIALAVKALRLDADDYLFKPVELENLYFSVSSCLEKAALRQKVAQKKKDLQLFKAVADFSNEAIVIWEPDGRVIYGNPAYERLFGWSLAEALKLAYGNFLTKKSDEILAKKILPALRSGKGWEGVLDSVDAKGRGFPLWQRIDAIFDEEDRITQIFSLMHDFTKEKQDAENSVNMQKMEALGTLAGGIAHEFNNILWIITANTELTASYLSAESPAMKNLRRVEKACSRATDLVTQILNFSRQNEYEPKPLEIVPIVKESLKLLRVSIPTTIEIRQNIPRQSGNIIFEPSLLHQVLMNLYTNSAHAMKETGGILEVSITNVVLDEYETAGPQDLAPGKYVKLSVSDTGKGIQPEFIRRIFDPFFTTRDTGDGTGMGLAVVHGAVKNHGGEVEVHSEQGKGTTFSLWFPMAGRPEKTGSKPFVSLPGGEEKILLVDDDEMVLEAGKSVLKRLGYKVECKSCAIEALAAFHLHPDEFDLVITDMSMPKMTGLMLAEALLKVRPDMPVILFTGHNDLVDESNAMEIGIRAFMMKPAKAGDMAKTIRKILDRSVST